MAREFLRSGEGVTLVGSLLNLVLMLIKLAAAVLGNRGPLTPPVGAPARQLTPTAVP